jgi:parvulin-like peptidyl-prolyl isomerase
MRTLRLLLAPLAVASPLAAGCGHDAPSVPKAAIAVVGDRTIARSQFDALMAEARRSYANRGRSFPAEGTTAYKALKRTAVRLLVEQAELEQKAPGLGVEVDEAQVEARLRRLKDDSFGGSEERYRARLRAAGMTDEQVRSALRAQILSAAVRQAVTADVTVGTQPVKLYYEAHLAGYSTPSTRAVRHILVRTSKVAGEVLARLRSGASFAALARRFSRDRTTQRRGGRLILVEGRTAPDLDRVAFSLANGAVSRPFETRFGWEVVQAVSPVRPPQVTPFASVRDGIRRQLLAQRRARAFQTWLANVRAELASRTVYAAGFAPDSMG